MELEDKPKATSVKSPVKNKYAEVNMPAQDLKEELLAQLRNLESLQSSKESIGEQGPHNINDREPKWNPDDRKDSNFNSNDPKWAAGDPKWNSSGPKWKSRDPKWNSGNAKWSSDDPPSKSGDPKWSSGHPLWSSSNPKWKTGGSKVDEEGPKWNSEGASWKNSDPSWKMPQGPKWDRKPPEYHSWSENDPNGNPLTKHELESKDDTWLKEHHYPLLNKDPYLMEEYKPEATSVPSSTQTTISSTISVTTQIPQVNRQNTPQPWRDDSHIHSDHVPKITGKYPKQIAANAQSSKENITALSIDELKKILEKELESLRKIKKEKMKNEIKENALENGVPKWNKLEPQWKKEDSKVKVVYPKEKESEPKWKGKEPMWKEKEPLWKGKEPTQKEKEPTWKEKDPMWKEKDPKWKDNQPLWKEKDPTWKDNEQLWKEKDPKRKEKEPKWKGDDEMWGSSGPLWKISPNQKTAYSKNPYPSSSGGVRNQDGEQTTIGMKTQYNNYYGLVFIDPILNCTAVQLIVYKKNLDKMLW